MGTQRGSHSIATSRILVPSGKLKESKKHQREAIYSQPRSLDAVQYAHPDGRKERYVYRLPLVE